MRRRQVLALLTGSLSLVTGCSSESGSTPDPTPTTNKTDTATTPESQMRTLSRTTPADSVDCDADPRPISRAAGDSYPERVNEFELKASKDVVTISGKIEFTLTNVGDAPQGIGEKYKYNILRQNDGWEPVYYTTRHAAWTDLGLDVYPGGGFRWPFTITSEGMERRNGYNPAYHVCAPLKPGKYRFAFFGLGDNVVATNFTVEDP